MTREQYIQLRKTNNFILLAYNQYYEKMVEKSATPMDFSIFAEWFPRYVGAQHIIDSLLDHYDSLFEIVLLAECNNYFKTNMIEGIVVRTLDSKFSAKIMNLEYDSKK